MKRIFSNRKLTLVMVLCVIAVFAATAYGAIVRTLLVKGTIAFDERFNGPADTFITRNTAEPGDTVSWHYHPGPGTVIITRGTFTLTEGCGGVRQFTAGQAFTEEGGPSDVHQFTNSGTEQGEFYFAVTVPLGSPRTIFVPGPRCGPPTSKDQCKDNGWLNFNFPRSFENQGDCVSYVNTGK